jgi:hypothetical protein
VEGTIFVLLFIWSEIFTIFLLEFYYFSIIITQRPMKSFLIILCLQFFVVLSSSGQSGIVTSGNNAAGTGGSVSYSIGQTVYSTVSGTNGTVSQGVQQPLEISVVTGIKDASGIIPEIYVYPNPANGYVKIVIENYEIEDLSYQLSDLLLTSYLGGESIAGGKLKETGTTHWQTPNNGATNETGFTALPGGIRGFDGSFIYLGISGHWWSATAINVTSIYSSWIDYFAGNVYGSATINYAGLSVRCLRD